LFVSTIIVDGILLATRIAFAHPTLDIGRSNELRAAHSRPLRLAIPVQFLSPRHGVRRGAPLPVLAQIANVLGHVDAVRVSKSDQPHSDAPDRRLAATSARSFAICCRDAIEVAGVLTSVTSRRFEYIIPFKNH
jgi:hypothetical protein